MKTVIFAGGIGPRLPPLTTGTNSHLLHGGSHPPVFHAIARVKQASIKDALVVAGRDHMGDVMELPGGGHDFGLDFTCEVQNQAGGIAQAQRTGARPTISSVPDRLGHDRTCAMNIGRLHETGWHPQEETALFPKTVEWLLRASGAGANDDH